VAEFSAQYYAHSITAKGLLLHDLDDTVVLHDESQKINHYWKASVLETTQGLGHSLQNKIVYKKITDFLSDSN
jgi:hypothetical protein